MMFSVFLSDAQELVQSYYYTDDYSIIPKMVLERENDNVIAYSITKNEEKKAGVLYINKDNTIKDAMLFQGADNYVINEIIEADNGNLLVSAEGYSAEGQESLYFIELGDNEIVNEFVFNENGNELDPFAILEIEDNILIGGFIKSRELISNSFYNMYTETQMIYVAKFTKSGEKIWSKGIELDGYEKGICNSMVKVKDGIVLLCHANKIGENMSPFLIKIDSEGNVKNTIQLYNDKFITIGSVLRISEGLIELIGSYSFTDKHFLFSALFSSNLVLVKSSEYQAPYRLMINGITNGANIYGAVLKGEGGYNNAIIKKENDGYSFFEFGTIKSDFIVGLSENTIFSYSFGSSSEHASTINFMKNDLKAQTKKLEKVENRLETNDEFKINYQTAFIKSNINTGVGKLKIVPVRNNLKNAL